MNILGLISQLIGIKTLRLTHGIAHWSVIKHAKQYEDLAILTKLRKQHD